MQDSSKWRAVQHEYPTESLPHRVTFCHQPGTYEYEGKLGVEDLTTLVVRSREGDADAFSVIVRRFQDMAVGYGLSLLHDFQLAEDAAQEAFLEAYLCLNNLREPLAFPGWFRRIVFKQCDRMTRGKQLNTSSLEDIEQSSHYPSQAETLERKEMNKRIQTVTAALPDNERIVITLHYLGGYSQQELGEFLDVPITTIKKRLFTARRRLREILIDDFGDILRERRPSKDESFSNGVMNMLNAARAGDVARVRELFSQNPRLLTAKDWLGNSALVLAATSGHTAILDLLYVAGVRPDIHEAASIGDMDRVMELLATDPQLLNSYSTEGGTPLLFAAHFGQLNTTDLLLKMGADINAVARNKLEVTPLHAALFGRRRHVAHLLVERGANVTLKRGGGDWPRSGWTALHYAAAYGFVELLGPLIARGADINDEDNEGKTALDVAREANQTEVVAYLRTARTKETT